MVGIIGAMDMEVDGLLQRMEHAQKEIISGITFYQGRLMGVLCVVARSGVGKVNAAVCAQTMALIYKVKIIINTGVAGGIGRDVQMGDVVISDALVQHDMDTTPVGDPRGFLSGIDRVEIPAAQHLVELAAEKARETYSGAVHVGVIATGDQFISDSKLLRAIAQEFSALACEMEGGSIAQVCCLNRIDFVVVRAISDNADGDAGVSFAQFAPVAAQKSVKLLCEILSAIS